MLWVSPLPGGLTSWLQLKLNIRVWATRGYSWEGINGTGVHLPPKVIMWYPRWPLTCSMLGCSSVQPCTDMWHMQRPQSRVSSP